MHYRYHAFRFAIIVALGGFVFGLDAALISGTVRFITVEFGLSDLEVGAVVSAPGFGVIFALLVTGYFSDQYGRKRTLQIIAALYLFSAVGSALAPNFIALVASRFLGGLAFTSLSLASMYIGEIAPPQLRGKLVSMNQINIVVGLSAAYFINYLILQASASGATWVSTLGIEQYTWRWMLGSEIIPAATWFILLFTIPKSPRWLVLTGRVEEASAVLAQIMPPDEIPLEIAQIKRSVQYSDSQLPFWSQVKKLFASGMRTAFWIGLTIAMVQPLTGINAILFYAPTVFEQVGIGTDAAFMQAIFVGLSSILFTTLALVLIDKIGRRPLTLWGLAWAVLSLIVCAYGFNQATYELSEPALQELGGIFDSSPLQSLVGIEYHSDVAFKKALAQTLGETLARTHESALIQSAATMPSTLILFGILSFISAYNFSVGPVMWVLFSEIFPVQLRGVAIPTFALVTSVLSYLVQQFFPWQLTHMGGRDIFFFYALLSFIGLIALYYILPETKNKSIEAIALEMEQRGGAPVQTT